MNDENKTDIIFINPPLSHEQRYGVKHKAGGQTPPTGLALLAAIMREKGYKVGLIDCPALDISYEDTAKQIQEKKPRFVGLTAATVSIINAQKLSILLKQSAPETKIIIGGPHITAVPQETVDRLGSFFDYAVIGEGDMTLPELIYSLDNKKPLSSVKGIGYFNDKEKKIITVTPPREIMTDLDSLPFPAWDLLPDLSKYYTPPAHTVKKFPAAILVPSRGCPNQCTFCDKKVFGSRIRSYSADYVLRMMKHLKERYGIKEIQFRDDNFLVFKTMVTELCNKIIEGKLDIVWSCTGRVDIANEDYLNLLKKAGCWQIWYGIESGSDKVLATIRKKTNVEMITKAIRLTKKAGISPCGFFMIGLPSETEEDIKKTINLLLKLPIDEFHIGHLVPLPGSEIYNTAEQYGKFNNDWEKMNGWKTLFTPKDMTNEKLVYYSNMAFRKFYFRPRIVFNYIKRLRSPRSIKVYFTALLGLLTLTSMKKRE